MSPYISLTMRSSTEGLWQPWCKALTSAQEGCGERGGWGFGWFGLFFYKRSQRQRHFRTPLPWVLAEGLRLPSLQVHDALRPSVQGHLA